MAEINDDVDDIVKINKTMSQICRGVDKKEDTMIMLTPSFNWSHLLMPAPVTIAILGDLIFISSGTDFSLEAKPPIGGFKHIRYPGSFRTSLVQLSNEGWKAFNQAHTSMDQIRIHSGNVDGHVRNAVKILMNGTNDEVKHLVPKMLGKIQNIAKVSRKLAETIELKFIDVMNLTGELLEACTSTKGVYDEKVQETTIAIQIAKEEENAMRRETEKAEERLKKINKQVSDAETDFKNKVSDLPSGERLLRLVAFETFVDAFRGITSIPATLEGAVFTLIQNMDLTAPFTEKKKSRETNADERTIDEKVSQHNVCQHVVSIDKHMNNLVQLVTGKKDSKNQVYPDWEKIGKGDAIFIKKSIMVAEKHVKKELKSGALGHKVLALCKEAIKVCDILIENQKKLDLTDDERDIQKLVKQVRKLYDKYKLLHAKASIMLGKNPLETQSPHLAKMETMSKSGSVLTVVREEARYKTELAKETLADARCRQEKANEESKITNEKLLQVLKDMKSLNIKAIDFEKVRETLINGIKLFSAVRAEWGKLVRFFEMLSNLISCSLQTSLTNFAENAGYAKEQTIGNMPLSKVFRDMVFEQALKASHVACFVQTISSTYVEISDKYLMDRIASVGKLVALDPVQDHAKIMIEKTKLHDGCEAAQEAMKTILEGQTKEFNKRIEQRLAKIKEIEDKLLPIESESLQRIQEITSQACHHEKSFNEDELSDLM